MPFPLLKFFITDLPTPLQCWHGGTHRQIIMDSKRYTFKKQKNPPTTKADNSVRNYKNFSMTKVEKILTKYSFEVLKKTVFLLYYILLQTNMNTISIKILNPKALDLLRTLSNLNLISIEEEKTDEMIDVVRRIRSKVKNPPSLEEITAEVEKVRSEMYALEH